MGLISRWFSGRKADSEGHAPSGKLAESGAGISSNDPVPVFDPRHPAASAIAAAEAVAVRAFTIQAGRRQITEYNTAECAAVLDSIEVACRLALTDVDLLYARACAQQLCLRGEDAAQTLAEVLRLAPAHFDASMRQQHSASWDTPFFFTGWDETKKEISELMAGHPHDWKGCSCTRCSAHRADGHTWKDGKCERCGVSQSIERFRAPVKPDPDYAPYFYCLDGLNLHPDIAADLSMDTFKALCPAARKDPDDSMYMIVPGGCGARYMFGYEGKLAHVKLDIRLSGTSRTGFMAFDKADPFFVWNQLGFGNFRMEGAYEGRLREMGAQSFSGYKGRTLIEGTVGRDGKVIEMAYLTKG